MPPFRLSPSGPVLLAGAMATALITASQLHRRSRLNAARDAPDSAPPRTSTVQRTFGGYTVTGRSITINRSPRAVYEFWRRFDNLAHVMENVASVRSAGALTEWQIEAPLGQSVRLETEIIEDRPGRLISWQSTPDSDIDTHGKVAFREAPAGRGTIVEVIIAYKPPAGRLGRAVARLTGREPFIQARQDLRRLKMLLETGEIADNRHYLPKEA
jgi:uncharacterized membrane protein